ncbi:MAG: NAD(P)/FAD-dependent oxidoreductase [Kiritimatiellia bacterium]
MKTIIIGGGASGLAAAAFSRNAQILEKLPDPGRKILVTGGGRCNLCHAGSPDEIAEAFNSGAARRFVFPALQAFPPSAQLAWFAQIGAPCKEESNGCCYPETERAETIRNALLNAAQKAGAQIETGCEVVEILTHNGAVSGVRTADGRSLPADRVILACGGAARPGLGSDGAAWRLAQSLGLSTIPPAPALGALFFKNREIPLSRLSGVTLPMAEIRLRKGQPGLSGGKHLVFRGGILLTGSGLSGPAALNACASIAAILELRSPQDAEKPVADLSWLADHADSAEWRTIFETARCNQGTRLVRTTLAEFLPASLADALCEISSIQPDCRNCQLRRNQLLTLSGSCAAFPLEIGRTESLRQAMVSSGGLSLREWKANTLECRHIKNLFATGEAIDVDAICGGYHLSWAWASGRLAALSAQSAP